MENKRYKKEQDIHLTKEEYLAQLKKYLKNFQKKIITMQWIILQNILKMPGQKAKQP